MNEKELTPVQQELDQAYRLLSTLPVSGDAVEVVASVRMRLRKAYELAAAKEKEDKEDKHGG